MDIFGRTVYMGGIYARAWCCPTCGIEKIEKFYIVVLWIMQFCTFNLHSVLKMSATLKYMLTLIFALEMLKEPINLKLLFKRY
jgi:hypothetical protein